MCNGWVVVIGKVYARLPDTADPHRARGDGPVAQESDQEVQNRVFSIWSQLWVSSHRCPSHLTWDRAHIEEEEPAVDAVMSEELDDGDDHEDDRDNDDLEEEPQEDRFEGDNPLAPGYFDVKSSSAILSGEPFNLSTRQSCCWYCRDLQENEKCSREMESSGLFLLFSSPLLSRTDLLPSV